MTQAAETHRPEARLDSALEAVEQTSARYLGRWNHLVSTTNWEKGRIISEWRASLVAALFPATEYSDEAWSRRVGSVSSQHVGRLRRTFERFGEVSPQYAGLYWSHFYAALDWHDAEMWLEGAVQSRWSVAEMRQTRWEATGAPAESAPQPGEVLDAEPDEDLPASEPPPAEAIAPTEAFVDGLDESQPSEACGDDATAPFDADDEAPPAEAPSLVRPFAQLPPMPADVADAFEAFKLAIVNHRHAGWASIGQSQMLAVLDALKQFALAPAE